MESASSIANYGWTYYTYPDLTNLTAETWLMTKYFQELIDGTLAYVYKKLGDEKTARDYRDLWVGNPRIGLQGHTSRIIGENLIENI